VLGQLGNRVQHALRAFTPRDQKAVKATAQTMRPKAGLDIEAAITELAVGEALVSLLDTKGRPSETERVFVLPPGSQLGPITPDQRQALLQNSLVAGVYEKVMDRESAYEMFRKHAGAAEEAPAETTNAPKTPRIPGAAKKEAEADSGGIGGMVNEALFGRTGPRGGQYDGLVQTMAKTAARSVASGIGRQIVRGVLGSLLGGKR
jgi:DNA helicase HerA-like ATPase